VTNVLLPISSARSAGERLGPRSVIVLQELPNGQWGYTSWGKTKPDCGRARAIADECLGAVEYAVAVEDGKI
jgi:hypothetical protein